MDQRGHEKGRRQDTGLGHLLQVQLFETRGRTGQGHHRSRDQDRTAKNAF